MIVGRYFSDSLHIELYMSKILLSLLFMCQGIMSKSEEPSQSSEAIKGSRHEVLPPKGNSLKLKSYHFTELQIEAAKLKAQGYSLSQIAQRLDREPHHISQALKSFRQVASRMRMAVLELRRVHYWDKQYDRSQNVASGQEISKQMLLAGLWPFGLDRVPLGYAVGEGRKLVFDSEKIEFVKRIFMRAKSGEAPFIIAKDEGFKCPESIYAILRSPLYKGCIRYGGKIYAGKHDKIVDEETWEMAQKMMTGIRGVVPRFGFKRSGPNILIDSEKTKVIQEVCRLRLERKSYKTIGAALGLKDNIVREILRASAYRDVIGSALWDRAHGVRISRKEKGEELRSRNDLKIILRLRESPVGLGEIMKASELGETSALSHLRGLRRKGIVDKEPGWHGKYYLLKVS